MDDLKKFTKEIALEEFEKLKLLPDSQKDERLDDLHFWFCLCTIAGMYLPQEREEVYQIINNFEPFFDRYKYIKDLKKKYSILKSPTL